MDTKDTPAMPGLEELRREISEVGSLIGAAITKQEVELLYSQLIAFMRTGRKPDRSNLKPKPLRAFAMVGGSK